MKSLFFSIFLIWSLTATSQSKSRLSLEETKKLYDSLIVRTTLTSMPWTGGSVSQCNRGSISQDIINKATDRINFFRKVNGLPLLYNNRRLNPDAQAAAFLIAVNHKVTHAPTQDMKCFSPLAYNGCQKSCLGLPDWQYHSSTAFIVGFIEDFGDANYYVGHRRWLLYSQQAAFGYGATNESEAIMTVDGITDKPDFTPEYIAYPWNGYVPNTLVFPKWSFSIPVSNKSIDFSKTKIIVKDKKGNPLDVTILKLNNASLDPTIVWIVNDLFTSDEIKKGNYDTAQAKIKNQSFYVLIQNIKIDNQLKNYNYQVQVF